MRNSKGREYRPWVVVMMDIVNVLVLGTWVLMMSFLLFSLARPQILLSILNR